MALTDKLYAIADAIRDKTDKTDKLTLPQMVEEINNHWHNYVKEVEYIGSFDKAGSLIGLVWSYTPEGMLVLTTNSVDSSYEHVYWVLRTAPEGVSIVRGREPDNWEPTGEPEQFISCLIGGISQNCKLSVEQTDSSSTYDYVEISVDIEYI